MNRPTLTGLATAEQIAKWKSENPDGIYCIECGGHVAYFRNPDMKDLNAATATITQDNPLDYCLNIARDTYLGGSKELFEGDTNAALKLDFIETVKPKLDGKKGKLVNL